MHDVIALERRGLPAVALLSDAFEAQALYQAAAPKLSAASRLFVKHPVSDQSNAALEAKADAVFDRLHALLTRERTLPGDAPRAAVDAVAAELPDVFSGGGACCGSDAGGVTS